MSPLAPDQQLLAASRLFLGEIEHCIASKADFAFETTLSGKSYIKLMRRLQSDGWRIELIYLALPNVEMSLQRVAERVIHGGHDIPVDNILRRFPRSLYNLLYLFSPMADQTFCLMNNDIVPEMVYQQIGAERSIINTKFYEILVAQAKI